MATKSEAKNAGGQDSMSLMEHLAELRMRLIRSILAIALGAAGVLAFYDPVLQFLTKPYRDLCASRPDFKCGTNENRRLRRLDFGSACIALATLEIHRACLEQERKAIHNTVHRICCYFVQPRMFDRILDTFEGAAVFNFVVRHRSQPSISNNQVHQSCYIDDFGFWRRLFVPVANCISATGRSSYAAHITQTVALCDCYYFLHSRDHHAQR